MNRNSRGATVRTATGAPEKRGGYGSSSKVVTKLTPPPRGVAPGVRPSAGGKQPEPKAK